HHGRTDTRLGAAYGRPGAGQTAPHDPGGLRARQPRAHRRRTQPARGRCPPLRRGHDRSPDSRTQSRIPPGGNRRMKAALLWTALAGLAAYAAWTLGPDLKRELKIY